jgi:hypothetical protein
VGPAGVATFNVVNDLNCLTGPKYAFRRKARKRFFPELSNPKKRDDAEIVAHYLGGPKRPLPESTIAKAADAIRIILIGRAP